MEASHTHAQFNFLDKAKSATSGVSGGEKALMLAGLVSVISDLAYEMP
jgi:hypothetical protein